MEREKLDLDLIVSTTVKIPMTPNFLTTNDGRTIPIQEAPDSALRAIGSAWTEALVKKAGERRHD